MPHYTTFQKATKLLLAVKSANRLLETTVVTLCENKRVALAAIDSTGLQAGHISPDFVQRKRSTDSQTVENITYRHFPKLAVVRGCFNHMVLSMFSARGPSLDINQFCRTLKPAAYRFQIEHLLADAGYVPARIQA